MIFFFIFSLPPKENIFLQLKEIEISKRNYEKSKWKWGKIDIWTCGEAKKIMGIDDSAIYLQSL